MRLPGKLNKKLATGILRKMYRRLESPDYPIVFGFSITKGVAGEWVPGESGECYIDLNPHEDLVPTIIHEMLHELYQKAPHPEIDRLEKEMLEHLSARQCQNLLKKIAWFL